MRNGYGNGNGNGKCNTPRKKSVVGPQLNFRNVAYSPIYETGVVFLFGMIAAELGFLIEEVRTEFPDCIARRRCGDRWEQVAIEFEWNSKKFSVHEDDRAACDLCVCWIHDYPDCPVEVLELRKVLTTLPNPPFCPPDSQTARN